MPCPTKPCQTRWTPSDARIFGSRPVVFIGHNPETLPKSSLLVSNDQRETARAAARELLATGYANFAFVNAVVRKKWSELRERGFTEALAINGKKCAVFRASTTGGEGINWLKGLRRFIVDLKKPCAVFAANDKTAECVISTAALDGFVSPGDIAVVGVDNYEPICEHITPRLTSIEPDFRRGGRLAATMLLGLAMSKGEWRLRAAKGCPSRIDAHPCRARQSRVRRAGHHPTRGLQRSPGHPRRKSLPML